MNSKVHSFFFHSRQISSPEKSYILVFFFFFFCVVQCSLKSHRTQVYLSSILCIWVVIVFVLICFSSLSLLFLLAEDMRVYSKTSVPFFFYSGFRLYVRARVCLFLLFFCLISCSLFLLLNNNKCIEHKNI